LLKTVITALRLPSDPDLESEARDLITAAKLDLELSGVLSVKTNDHEDALIKRAIVTYCKANFGWDNPEAERFQKSYESLRNHLSLSAEYSVVST
jgi:hypothetical protein